MVYAVNDHNEADFIGLACENPAYGAGMLANYATYHRDERYLSQWVIYNTEGCAHLTVQLYQQAITVCCAEEDTDCEAFADFLSLMPDYQNLVAPIRFIMSLPERVKKGKRIQSGSMMVLPHRQLLPPVLMNDAKLTTKPSLDRLFVLLCECSDDYRRHANYNFWYTDLSYRIRHGTAQSVAVKQGGIYVSAACAFYLTGSAVIRDVCTLQDRRRQGYAKAAVVQLSHSLLQAGLTPHLLSVSPHADRLYESVGFQTVSKWAGLYNK